MAPALGSGSNLLIFIIKALMPRKVLTDCSRIRFRPCLPHRSYWLWRPLLNAFIALIISSPHLPHQSGFPACISGRTAESCGGRCLCLLSFSSCSGRWGSEPNRICQSFVFINSLSNVSTETANSSPHSFSNNDLSRFSTFSHSSFNLS